MYYREMNGIRIDWDPEDETAAEQAMKELVDRFDEWNGSPYKVDYETARAVQDRYADLTGEPA